MALYSHLYRGSIALTFTRMPVLIQKVATVTQAEVTTHRVLAAVFTGVTSCGTLVNVCRTWTKGAYSMHCMCTLGH